jgi:hypothetical protein
MPKGGGYERDKCKELSLWWTGGERDDVFWRTPGSGARATTRMKIGVDTADSAGDMLSIDETGKPLTHKCLFEFKRGYGGVKRKKQKTRESAELHVLAMLDNPKMQETEPLLYQFWRKGEKERRQHKRQFTFIIFKRDRKDDVICMSQSTFDWMNNRLTKHWKGTLIEIRYGRSHLILLRLDKWLRWCNPYIFKQQRIIKRRSKNAYKNQRWRTGV